MRKLAASSIVASLDYAVVSVVKVFIGVFLARYAIPAEFGVFAIATSLLTFYSGLQLGVVGEPLTVLTASLQGRRLAQYIGTGVVVATGLSFLLSVLTAIIAFVAYRSGIDLYPGTFVFLSLVIWPVQLQDLFRRILFAQQHSGSVLINDVVSSMLQIGGLFWIQHTHHLAANNALLVIGAGALIAVVLGGVQIHRTVGVTVYSYLPKSLHLLSVLWNYGRWSFGSQIAFNVSTQGYLYAAGVILGPTVAGILKACQNLIAPIQLVLIGMDSILIAFGSQKYDKQGLKELGPFLRLVGLAMISISLLYVAVVVYWSDTLLDWLYRGQYSGYGMIVSLYAIYYFVFAVARPYVLGLRSIRQPIWIFRGYLASTVFALFSFIPLIRILGVEGVLLGYITTATVFLLIVGIGFTVNKRRLNDLVES